MNNEKRLQQIRDAARYKYPDERICKGLNGWVPFTVYGCDISPKKTVEFINRINDAADVLNRKEE